MARYIVKADSDDSEDESTVKKLISSKVLSDGKREALIKAVMDNMMAQAAHHTQGGILLAGDPGVGKTSFVKFFAQLIGVNCLTIEVPHISDEHIINIPFIETSSRTGKTVKGNLEGEEVLVPVIHPTSKTKVNVSVTRGNINEVKNTSEYQIVLAESQILTRIRATKRIPDKTYLANIYKTINKDFNSEIVKEFFELLGGTETSIPRRIQVLRKRFLTILFLDEYFRETSMSTRNMLRGILNRAIGVDELPNSVYAIYASNMADDGIGDKPANQQYTTITMESPDKDEWFKYVEERSKVMLTPKNAPAGFVRPALKPDVLKVFKELITKDNLSIIEDEVSKTGLSPRRWEQLLNYVNYSLPAKSTEDAKALLTNVETTFKNHLTGDISKLGLQVVGAVANLINSLADERKSRKIGPNPDVALKSIDRVLATGWVATLKQQITLKAKLGDLRTSMPVVSGPPGIGKTTIIKNLADELKMSFINIDCSTLSFEDVMGMPLKDRSVILESEEAKKEREDRDAEHGIVKSDVYEDSEIKVEFSDSKLYKIILTRAKRLDVIRLANFKLLSSEISELKSLSSPSAKDTAKLAELEAEHAKYLMNARFLIFFDELNRTDVKTFNGLRNLILEKKFSNNKPVPPGTIMIGAINPSDEGSESLTPLTKHMLDVLDIIEAKPCWSATEDHLKEIITKSLNDDTMMTPSLRECALATIIEVQRVYSSLEIKRSKEEKPFYLTILAQENEVYMSPREYTQIFGELAYAFDSTIENEVNKYNKSKSKDETKITSVNAGNLDKLVGIEGMIREQAYIIFRNMFVSILDKQQQTDTEQALVNFKTFMMAQSANPLTSLVSMRAKATKLSICLDGLLDKKFISLRDGQNVEASLAVQYFKVLDTRKELDDDLIAYFEQKTITDLDTKYKLSVEIDDALEETSEEMYAFPFVVQDVMKTVVALTNSEYLDSSMFNKLCFKTYTNSSKENLLTDYAYDYNQDYNTVMTRYESDTLGK